MKLDRRRLLGGLCTMGLLPSLGRAADVSALPDYDGADTLATWRQAVAEHQAGKRKLLKVGLTGDSTFDFVDGTQPFKDHLQEKYGDGGLGWLCSNGRLNFTGGACSVSVTGDPMTGWVAFDASPTHDADGDAPCGIGPDLKAIYTDGTAAYVTFRQLTFSRFRVFYDNAGGGSFAVSVDKEIRHVKCTGKKTVGVVDFNVADGAHDIRLITHYNTGRVAIMGFAAERPEGLVVNKIANGGTDSFQMLAGQNNPYVQSILKHLEIDLHFYSMGTNCCRYLHSPVPVYRQALDQFCRNAEAARPGASIIVSTMGQFFEETPGAPSHVRWEPTDYVAEGYVAAQANHTAYLNWWHLTGDYNTAQAAGLWRGIHPTPELGAKWIDTAISDFNL